MIGFDSDNGVVRYGKYCSGKSIFCSDQYGVRIVCYGTFDLVG